MILFHGDEEGRFPAQFTLSETQPASARVAVTNSSKTSEPYEFRRNTSDVGGLEKPLGKSLAQSEIQSPRATAGRLYARPRARLEYFGGCLSGRAPHY